MSAHIVYIVREVPEDSPENYQVFLHEWEAQREIQYCVGNLASYAWEESYNKISRLFNDGKFSEALNIWNQASRHKFYVIPATLA